MKRPDTNDLIQAGRALEQTQDELARLPYLLAKVMEAGDPELAGIALASVRSEIRLLAEKLLQVDERLEIQ